MDKKLQVFVSSTYTDLQEERQAAVEAILDSGHIPAGMELFISGNGPQLKTIYKWMDESDVYMLILGGRYGSIEEKSGKSYTQLEYEYALNKSIPVFAVVLSQSFLTKKINTVGLDRVTEQIAPDKYRRFKTLVMAKTVREVDDCKDIKLAIHTTLKEFMNEYDLTGWIRNTYENDITQLIKENNALLKENNFLNKQIQKIQEQLNTKPKEKFGNYSFEELVNILKNKSFHFPSPMEDITTNALDFFIDNYNVFASLSIEQYNSFSHTHYKAIRFLEAYDLIYATNVSSVYLISKTGNLFYIMLEANNMVSD